VITVTTESRLRRTVPVRVYDPTVLDVGEIQIKYVDTFECIPQGGPTTAPRNESFYRPVAPEGWSALGSFRLPESGCRDINGTQWMMVVKQSPAAAPVTSFDESVGGDLPSGDPSDPPRALAFAAGNNQVRGSVGGQNLFDSFSFTLKPGEYLNSVVLEDFAGTQGTVRFLVGTDASAPPPAFLGEAVMSSDQIGTNYLQLLGLDLDPGVYTISIAANDPHAYEFVLNIGTNPSPPPTPPLVKPSSYYNPIDDYYGWTLWAPVCPDGYVAMGGVATTTPDVTQPVGAATCVRRDLTVPGLAPQDYFSTTPIEAPNNANEDVTTAYIETGTMSVHYRQGFPEIPQANVLAVELPLLIDVPSQSWAPHLTSANVPPRASEPVLTKVLLVPFTILNGQAYTDKGVGWMVENSPFVRVERAQV
jgi:hypothetical protein